MNAPNTATPSQLFHAYIFDLDGTIYLGDALLPTAGETITRLRELGQRTVFLSNNPTHTRLRTNRPIRSTAISIWSSAVAKQQRTKPSPPGPKALPGTQATFSSFNNWTANSFELSPVDRIDGNA
jgi:hypothetical protein